MRIHISNGMDFVASSRFGRESDRQLERRRELERGRAFGPGGTTKSGSRNFETCSESLFLCFIELALALGPGFSTEETPRELESVRSRSLRRTARAALLVCTLASRHSAFSILNFSAVSDLFSALSFSYETVKKLAGKSAAFRRSQLARMHLRTRAGRPPESRHCTTNGRLRGRVSAPPVSVQCDFTRYISLKNRIHKS